MLRRHRQKRGSGDLELTTFLNVLVVLMCFLLVSAVFSRIAIQELRLPTAAAGTTAPAKPLLTIEVIVRRAGIEIGDGRRVVMAIPKSGDQYNIERLSEYLQRLKSQYSDKTDATLLVEPEVAYDDVIRVIDAVKIARVLRAGRNGKNEMQPVALFPDVSIGDAP
jgi:biopolymer transport protein ExbD